ncbi:MAG: 2-oxoacid:acceptor oxidoreductase subunit alpha, partial [Bacteroidetes bacterium]|nr:2-oxoacid:acceptor oxidoreductase subunit alpha [Bacteroidota bacterium]
MYEFAITAFNMAEKYRVPTFLTSEEAIGHLWEKTTIHETVDIVNRHKQPGAPPFGTDQQDGVPPMPCFGEGENLMVTGSTHDPLGFRKTDDPVVHENLVRRINHKILNHRDDIVQTESSYVDDADVLIVSYGFTARSVAFACEICVYICPKNA